jgi:hypothetical protein
MDEIEPQRIEPQRRKGRREEQIKPLRSLRLCGEYKRGEMKDG